MTQLLCPFFRSKPRGDRFITEDAVGTREDGYLRTVNGELLEVSEKGISRITTPGFCEAIAPSGDGALLARFQGIGIFELRQDWRKLLPCPYDESRIEYHVHLAAMRGAIALAISHQSRPVPSLPQLSPNAPASTVQSPGAALWVSQGQVWKPVKISADK